MLNEARPKKVVGEANSKSGVAPPSPLDGEIPGDPSDMSFLLRDTIAVLDYESHVYITMLPYIA